MKRLLGKHLLIVDKDTDSRILLETVFTSEGARVKTASSTPEALQILDSYCLDLVLSEVALPEWDGYALINYIRTRKSLLDSVGIKESSKAGRLPVIAVTAFDDGYACNRALKAGFDAFFLKPVDIDWLVEQAIRLTQSHNSAVFNRPLCEC